jgi:transcription-repair coupling factor (superfamily II helicase)
MKTSRSGFASDWFAQTPVTLAGVPQGMEALALAELRPGSGPLAHIISDGQRIADLEQNLAFYAPDIPVLTLPGWDCLPYDRVSPGRRCLGAAACGAVGTCEFC